MANLIPPLIRNSIKNSMQVFQDKTAIDDVEETCEIFSRKGVGSSILYKRKVLIVMHSTQILFYKRERIENKDLTDNEQARYKWKEYQALDLEG